MAKLKIPICVHYDNEKKIYDYHIMSREFERELSELDKNILVKVTTMILPIRKDK